MSEYINSSMITLVEGKNYFSWNRDEFYGNLIFKNAQIGSNYEFEARVFDGFGNQNTTSMLIKVRDGVNIRILDSENAKVDFGGFAWITKNNAPKLKFSSSRKVEKCSIYPFVDDRYKGIVSEADRKQISKSIFGSDVLDNNFEFDLSTFDKFNLEALEDKMVEINVRCNYDNKTYNFIRTLEYIDALPDYVLTSSNGFVLNGGDYDTTIDVKSVGVNKYISCKYSIDGQTAKPLSDDVKTKFSEEINFKTKGTGVYDLTLVCEDKLGTVGPTKIYKFAVNKNLDIEIEDLKLISGNKEFEVFDNKIYVSEFKDLGLSFRTNRNDISCSYEIEKSSGEPLRNALYFIENLFIAQREVPAIDEKNYVFNIDNGLEFSSTGKNLLKIVCSGGNTLEKDYEVYYLNDDSEIDFGLRLVS